MKLYHFWKFDTCDNQTLLYSNFDFEKASNFTIFAFIFEKRLIFIRAFSAESSSQMKSDICVMKI